MGGSSSGYPSSAYPGGGSNLDDDSHHDGVVGYGEFLLGSGGDFPHDWEILSLPHRQVGEEGEEGEEEEEEDQRLLLPPSYIGIAIEEEEEEEEEIPLSNTFTSPNLSPSPSPSPSPNPNPSRNLPEGLIIIGNPNRCALDDLAAMSTANRSALDDPIVIGSPNCELSDGPVTIASPDNRNLSEDLIAISNPPDRELPEGRITIAGTNCESPEDWIAISSSNRKFSEDETTVVDPNHKLSEEQAMISNPNHEFLEDLTVVTHPNPESAEEWAAACSNPNREFSEEQATVSNPDRDLLGDWNANKGPNNQALSGNIEDAESVSSSHALALHPEGEVLEQPEGQQIEGEKKKKRGPEILTLTGFSTAVDKALSMVWWKQYSSGSSSAIRTDSVLPFALAATVVSVAVLGYRWHRERRQNQQLWRIFHEKDEKINELMNQLIRMKDALAARQRVPVIKLGIHPSRFIGY